MGRDSSVGIATRYGLDGPGIESRWGWDYPHPSIPAPGPTLRPIQWAPGLFRGIKRPGRGVDHPPLSSAEVKERVELYLYPPPFGLSWPVLGWPLPLTYKNCKFLSEHKNKNQWQQHFVTVNVFALGFCWQDDHLNKASFAPRNHPLSCSEWIY